MTNAALHYFVSLLIVSIVMLPLHARCRTTKARERVSILLGVWMLFILSPRLLLVWPAYWCVAWGLAAIIERTKDERSRSSLLLLGILILLLPMFLWKLHEGWFEVAVNRSIKDILETISPLLSQLAQDSSVGIEIGLSIASFRAVDMLICTHLEIIKTPRFREALHFGFFAPVLIIGPIIQIQEITQKVPRPENTYTNIIEGLMRVAWGFAKLFLLAIPLSFSQFAVIGFQDNASLSQAELIGQTIIFAWYFYFNFSAFSDLAIGIARMYGYSIRENFNLPYFKPSPQRFWANWHMSLTSFAQRNIFVPLGGFRKQRRYIATFMTMMVIALWHGFTVSMLIYGIVHAAVLMAIEFKHMKWPRSSEPGKFRVALSTLATFLLVAGTAPLLVLGIDDIAPFYGLLLIGIAP